LARRVANTEDGAADAGYHKKLISLPSEEAIMAKGQKRSSRESKKPKAEKPKTATTSSSFLKEKPSGGSKAKK
jgi:hypothetical protein